MLRSVLATVAAAATAVAGLALVAPAVAATPAPALFVSEILPDNTTHSFVDAGGVTRTAAQDNFEFFEVTNTTNAPIDLTATGYSFAYINGANRTALSIGADSPQPAIVPANGSAVFWLRYSAGTADGFSGSSPNAMLFDEADFRSHYGIDATAPLVFVTGQAGFANSGTRGLAIQQGTSEVSTSTYTRAAAVPATTTPEPAIHFIAPGTDQTAAAVLGEAATSPGTVAAAQLPSGPGTPTPTPTVTPTETPTATPTPTPTGTPGNPEVGPGAAGNAGAYFPLAITEIMGDNPSTDLYEYLEVTNTTTKPIDLDAAGVSIRYHTSQWNAGSDQPVLHLAGERDSPTIIPAGGVALFWMNYADGSAQRGMSKQQFRDYYNLGADVPVFRFGNQAGFANGGARGFSLVQNDQAISRAWVEAGAIDSSGGVVQFAAPEMVGGVDALVVAKNAPRTPGSITTAQVTSALKRPTDPSLQAPLLQITEVAPDTANVGGGDGYEFIEVYNASDAPVNFGDYVMNYLYTDNALSGPVTTSSTLWAANPSSPTIQPGRTVVLWIKNAANQALTAADFNSQFGTRLVAGESLLEIQSGGFSNGGSRGIQVLTNTGHDVSRAYYFDDAQTTPTTAIQYAWKPDSTSAVWTPEPADGTVQTLMRLAPPTPGSVTDDQVRPGLVPSPAAGTAPVITDLTGGTETPETPGLDLGFDVRDDVQVRTVALRLVDNLGAVTNRNLTFDGPGRYYYSVPEADLFGKQWVEYSVVATDGFQNTSLRPVRVDVAPAPSESVRLNLTEGQYVSGSVRVQGTSDTDVDGLGVEIDGRALNSTTPSLETGPVFAFEATATDAFFRNGVKLGDDVLKIFDEGFYSRIVTVDAAVPVDRVTRGELLTLNVTAGTKAYPNADPNENNDDFSAMNFRLALPDGRVLDPVSCTTTKEAGGAETAPAAYPCPTADTRVGFSDANLVSLNLNFDVPDDAFDSIAGTWNTTEVADGEHVVVAKDAAARTTRKVNVDNTAPSIQTPLVADRLYRGSVEIAATSTDAGAGVDTLTATLDGGPITLPFATSSLELAPGAHTVVFTAEDKVGNTATRSVAFRTADERPGIVLNAPAADGTVEGDRATLSATATSEEADALDLAFREGYSFAPGDAEVTAGSGTTTDSRTTDRSDATAFSADELAKLVGTDGVDVETASDAEFPYQLFTVDVPAGAGTDALARVEWQGNANADAKVQLYVRTVAGGWELVDDYLTTDDAPTDFVLGAMVPVDGHAVDGELTFLVQHSEGFAGTARSTRTPTQSPFNPGATPRDQYDFTFAWESDTQYYNDNQGYRAGTDGDDVYYGHQVAIHDFLLENRDELNLQYMLHTGDIVDDYIASDRAPGNTDPAYQWKNADAQYDRLDAAGLPYGVLAGNHDVGGAADDYSQYSAYFGEDRYAANPWYGGSYKNNRGHYELVSVDGVDFLMLYMSWPAVNNDASNDEDIAWMNSVIAQFPERKVWVNLHEYMLTTGGLGPIPTRVYDEVVKPNPNVFAVSSGHYHDAYTRTDDFDDDGDGTADRTVYSMLFDYQGLQEGGLGYLRLLHFDNESGRIIVRTYSPSLDVFNSDDAALNSPAGMQDFVIPYSAVGLTSTTKTLATDSFRADILTTKQIGAVPAAPSGSDSTVVWSDLTDGEHGWFVSATGPHGGLAYSEVRSFTSTGGENSSEPGGPGNPGEPGNPGGPDDGQAQPSLTVNPSSVTAGSQVTVHGTGLAPSQRYQLILRSEPVILSSSVTTNVDGELTATVTIPAGTALGAHTLQLVATDAPAVVVASASLTVVAATLPATGVDVGQNIAFALLLMLAGVALVTLRRVRRRA